MIGLALSGGGARAIAFHLGCLRALDDLAILPRIRALSTISGGSVIGAYYAYTPQKSFTEFEADIRKLLRSGLQARIAWELLKPANLLRCLGTFGLTSSEALLCKALRREPRLLRYPSRSDLFHRVLARDVLGEIALDAPRRDDLDIIIGACELRTGTAFRFSNRRSGSWRHGELIGTIPDVAFSVAASAAYPLLLPAFERRWRFRLRHTESERRVLLTDGGVYDNLGTAVLDPGRNDSYSLHVHRCDYVIACSAGHGQATGQLLPRGLYDRVSQAFNVIHRRVQDAAMQRLHGLRDARLLRGFALPYLGQQDDKLPCPPPDLVPRASVLDYPTDFAAMSDEWIERLSLRGEQVTRLLVSYYLPELCG